MALFCWESVVEKKCEQIVKKLVSRRILLYFQPTEKLGHRLLWNLRLRHIKKAYDAVFYTVEGYVGKIKELINLDEAGIQEWF